MKIYFNVYGAWTDKLLAEAEQLGAVGDNLLKANLTYVGRSIYVIVESRYYSPVFSLNEVVKAFPNLRSAERSNEWKTATKMASVDYEPEYMVRRACITNDRVYAIIELKVCKDRYFRRKSFGRHTRLVTSGVVYSRKIDYTDGDDRRITVAVRPGNRNKHICRIFGYDVIETKDCYKVYDGNGLVVALPPDISFMRLICEVGAIDDLTINGWR